ncbi:ATP-binding protein [Mesorhizobium sp. M0029]|uniref:ATP-binding protein n=1 Tax=Mesorhizobium sp. M0029 TaxID=2956850 RepID=UPI00333819F8
MARPDARPRGRHTGRHPEPARSARLRFPEACIEDIDFAAPRGLDRRGTMALAQGEWLKAHENLIVTGQTGTGKSWLACAFGRQAARLDHSVLYVRVPRLFEDLALARLDGRFPRLIDKLTRAQLLILDDFGTHSLTDQQRFLEGTLSPQIHPDHRPGPVARWHDLIADPTVADAILDRIVHNAHRVVLQGDSMRKQKAAPLLTGTATIAVDRLVHSAYRIELSGESMPIPRRNSRLTEKNEFVDKYRKRPRGALSRPVSSRNRCPDSL